MCKFSYKISESDYLEYNNYHAFNSPESKQSMLIYRNVFAIVFIICGLAFGAIGALVDMPYISYSFYITFGIVTVLWLIFFKWIMKKQIKKNIGRVKKKGELYQGNVMISLDDDFIIETTEDGEAKVKYFYIDRVIMSEKTIYIYINAKQAIMLPFSVFYLYINAMQAILLPFSVFATEQSRDDTLTFIEEKCAAMKIPLRV